MASLRNLAFSPVDMTAAMGLSKAAFKTKTCWTASAQEMSDKWTTIHSIACASSTNINTNSSASGWSSSDSDEYEFESYSSSEEDEIPSSKRVVKALKEMHLVRRDGDEKRRTSFRRKKIAAAGSLTSSEEKSDPMNSSHPWKDQLQAVAARMSHNGGARPSGESSSAAGRRGEGEEGEGMVKHVADTFYDLKSEYPENTVIPTECQPVVLVDGYNLCGAWPKLKKHFLRGDLEEARERLISEVLPYRSYAEVNLVVVFDACNNPPSGSTGRMDSYGVDVVYSHNMSADEWIEQEVHRHVQHHLSPYITVVTSDVNLRLSVLAKGGFVKNCTSFIQELKEAHEQPQEHIFVPGHQRSHLADQLPEDTLYGLLSMRREAAGDDPYYRDYIVKYDITAQRAAGRQSDSSTPMTARKPARANTDGGAPPNGTHHGRGKANGAGVKCKGKEMSLEPREWDEKGEWVGGREKWDTNKPIQEINTVNGNLTRPKHTPSTQCRAVRGGMKVNGQSARSKEGDRKVHGRTVKDEIDTRGIEMSVRDFMVRGEEEGESGGGRHLGGGLEVQEMERAIRRMEKGNLLAQMRADVEGEAQAEERESDDGLESEGDLLSQMRADAEMGMVEERERKARLSVSDDVVTRSEEERLAENQNEAKETTRMINGRKKGQSRASSGTRRKDDYVQPSGFVGVFGSQEASSALQRLKQSLQQEKKRR